MKKLIALIMALAMIAVFAACGTTPENNGENNKENVTDTTADPAGDATEDVGGEENVPPSDDTTTAVDILDYTWGNLPEDQKPAVIGGHYSNEFTSGPATYEMAHSEELAGLLLIPQDQMQYVTDAATVMHMMNGNHMTIGLVKISQDADMQAIADKVHENISNHQWMCGFPEKLIIAQVHQEYLFIAFGLNDLLDPFFNNIVQSWNTSELYNEAIQ